MDEVNLNEELAVFESKPMSDENKAKMQELKLSAAILLKNMNSAVAKEERSEASRLMAIARTNLEQSIMWAVKAISRI